MRTISWDPSFPTLHRNPAVDAIPNGASALMLTIYDLFP